MSSSHDEPDGLKLEWKWGLPLILLTIIGAAVLILGLLEFRGSGSQRAPTTATIGFAAPAFTLTTPDGDRVALGDYAGSPTVVHFWASWCKACQDDLVLLGQARGDHAAEFEVLGIIHADDSSTASALSTERRVPWPMLLDPDGETWRDYAAIDVPASYFIDDTGVLRSVSVRPLDAASLAAHLTAIGVEAPG